MEYPLRPIGDAYGAPTVMLGVVEAGAAQLDSLPRFSIASGREAAAIVRRGLRAGARVAPSLGGGGGGGGGQGGSA